jgi:MFS family permease
MNKLTSSTFTSTIFRIALVNFLINYSIEATLIFLPLHAKSLGASDMEIGVLAATYGLAFFLSSFIFGRLSDLHGRVIYIRTGLCFSIVAYSLLCVVPSPLLLIITRGAIGFSLGINAAALAAYTFDTQKQVGNFASYGALGWLAGAVTAIFITNPVSLFMASTASSIIALVMTFTFKETQITPIKVDLFPAPVFKANFKVYFSFFIRQAGATAAWAIFPLFLTSIGATKTWIAIFDILNMGTQFLTMRFIERFNARKILIIGLFVSSIMFAIYGLVPNYIFLIPVQIFIGISWSCMFDGALSYLMVRNKERGTASGLLYSTLYLSGGLGPFIGGAVSQAWGYVTLMFVSSGLGFTGFFTSLGIKKDDN